MKRKFLLFAAIICIFLGGCKEKEDRINEWLGSEDDMSNAIMKEIVEALDAKDEEALKNMFSKPALGKTENLDQQIEDMFEFYQGKIVSYDGSASSSTRTGGGAETKEFIAYYTLVTDEERYQVTYDHKPVDDEHPEEIGLRRLELVTEEEYEMAAETNEQGSYQWVGGGKDSGVYIPESAMKQN